MLHEEQQDTALEAEMAVSSFTLLGTEVRSVVFKQKQTGIFCVGLDQEMTCGLLICGNVKLVMFCVTAGTPNFSILQQV